MVKRILFFSLACGFFSLACGMENIQNLFEKYRPTFPDFVKEVRKETNIGKKVVKIGFLSSFVANSAKKRGYSGDITEDIEFLKRFFATEYKQRRKELIGKTKKLGTFGNTQHQTIVNSIFTQFDQGQDTSLNTLNQIIHQVNIKTFNLDSQASKQDICKKVLEKQNGKYTIDDETYFAQTASLLFTVHVHQTMYKDEK